MGSLSDLRDRTAIVGVNTSDIKCDMSVQVTFDDVTDEITLPRFKPV